MKSRLLNGSESNDASRQSSGASSVVIFGSFVRPRLAFASSATIRRARAFVLAILFIALVCFPARVSAAGETLTTDGAISGVVDEQIDLGLQVGGTGNDEITVSLYVAEGTLTFGTSVGLTFDGPSSGNTIEFTGNRSDINTALLTLTYSLEQPGVRTIEATIVSGGGEVFNPDNGHVYQAVYVDGGIDWADANAAAEASSYGGADGYLATITSEEEDEFIRARLSNNGWMGASDGDSYGTGEGDWNWVGGPDAGQSFWSGGPDGSPVGDFYVNWDLPWQPDNAGDEDCGEIVVGLGGVWNDLTCSTLLEYYIVEYGDSEVNPTVQSAEIEATVTGPLLSIGTCQELQDIEGEANANYATISLTSDIDCQGQTIEPLFDDESFAGTIDGNEHTISNFVIDQPNDSRAGLLASTDDLVTIRDLNLENIDVTGSYNVGGLIADGDGGYDISNVHGRDVHIVATEEGYAGGLFGELEVEDGYESSISDVSVEGTVYSSGEYTSNVGGMAGMIEATRAEIVIEQSYADVDVTNVGTVADNDISDVGGLIGEIEAENDNEEEGGDSSVTVQNSYAWGSVTAENSSIVGGLIGRADIEFEDDELAVSIQIESSYAFGNVTGLQNVGGLVGQFDEVDVEADGFYDFNNTFAMGRVTALEEGANSGGLVGHFDGVADLQTNYARNYFDQTRTTQAGCDPEIEMADDCVAVNIASGEPLYFINNSISAPLDTWDFEDIWVVNENLPPTFTPRTLQQDLNGDLIEDEDQPQISGYTSPATGKTVAVDVGEGCEITTDDLVAESNFEVQDPNYDYANGLFDFAGNCGDPGFTTTIRFFYYDVDPEGLVLRKHNPNDNTYFNIDGATLTESTIHGRQVTIASFQITDGGTLDMDGEENGEFTDPAGLANAASASGDLASTGQNNARWVVASILLLAGSFGLILYSRKSGKLAHKDNQQRQ
jgi:hypothetical protein